MAEIDRVLASFRSFRSEEPREGRLVMLFLEHGLGDLRNKDLPAWAFPVVRWQKRMRKQHVYATRWQYVVSPHG